MSEQDAAAEQPEPAENDESDADEQPDIEADERADVGDLADLADQVEAEAGADVDDTDDPPDGDETDVPEDGEMAPAAPSESGTTDWGDLYCSTVTTGLNAVIDEYGDEDAERIDESLARDLHLDQYVNEWMAQQGKAEMDPAQGMLVATAALGVTVLVSRTDLPAKAIQQVQDDA